MGGTSHSDLDLPTSVIHQENALQACPQAGGGIAASMVPSSQDSSLCHIDKTLASTWSV